MHKPILFLVIGGMILVSAVQCVQAQPAAETLAVIDSAVNCAPLPPSSGRQVPVSSVSALVSAINNAQTGDVILLADGTYALNGNYLWIDVPNLTLRSASGNREAVILDGNYQTTQIISVLRSNVTIADLTIKRAYTHPIHVKTEGSDTLNTKIYNVHIIDPGEQAIKINPGTSGGYPDDGEIACSLIELTDVGRPYIRNNCYTGGVDGHQAQDWVVRDNLIRGFWCDAGLSEHAVHFWRGSRDPVVERNILLDNARGIGFGLYEFGDSRTYADDPCPETSGYVDHFGGTAKNNFLAANDPDLFNSSAGFDCGICIWNACRVDVLHNTVYTANTDETYSAIEWRYPNTSIDLVNNLVNDQLMARDSATATTNSGNLTNAQSSWFENASLGDLHLVETALSAIDQVSLPVGVSVDLDGETRPIGSAADIGADEYGIPAPLAVRDLRLNNPSLVGNTLLFNLTWTEQNHTESSEIRYAFTPLTAASWDSASVLQSSIPLGTQQVSASVSYTSGNVYFSIRSQNSEGVWSEISNLVFWPSEDLFLPLVLR